MSIENKELPWVLVAREKIGQVEIKGKRNNPEIVAMIDFVNRYRNINRAWWHNDDVPWCGLFVAYCMAKANRHVPKNWYRAKAWSTDKMMTKLAKPAYGSIAVFNRKGGGHVGIVVGVDKKGRLLILGGNQSDAVNIKAFKTSRLVGCFWPPIMIGGTSVQSLPLLHRYDLKKIVAGDVQISTNEA